MSQYSVKGLVITSKVVIRRVIISIVVVSIMDGIQHK
jgi:hypothetical protein